MQSSLINEGDSHDPQDKRHTVIRNELTSNTSLKIDGPSNVLFKSKKNPKSILSQVPLFMIKEEKIDHSHRILNEVGNKVQFIQSQSDSKLMGYIQKSHGKDVYDKSTELGIHGVLSNSYHKRGTITKSSDTKKTLEVDRREFEYVTQWRMSVNGPICHTSNLAVNLSDNDKEDAKIPTNSNAYEKIVEPLGNRSAENIDILWTNPVIGTSCKLGIPSLISKGRLKKLDKVNSSFSFTTIMLKDIKVIGPVDDKFIACIINLSKCEEMLVLVDQHAAHERIRLEKLLCQVGYNSIDERKYNVESTRLSPPVSISVSESELSLMTHYKNEFTSVGLRFSFTRSKNSSFHRIFISTVPAIFVNGFEVQIEARGAAVNSEVLKEFIIEQINYMQSMGCSCNMSSQTVFKVLASYACHGAIKFGDRISLQTCEDIMTDLAKCDLPFQCAHGRPTIAPVFKFSNFLNVLEKSCPKPNLKKLKNVMVR